MSRQTRRSFIHASLAAVLAAHTLRAQQKQFETPAADMAGDWAFTPNPALPNVLLLGDSISIGYTRDVRTLLRNEANVYRPMSASGKKPANCGDTPMGLAHIHQWLGDTRWQVIHFNWGLWDLCYRNPESNMQGHRDKIHGTLTSAIPQYKANLEKLVAILEQTGAKLIWASTTVVPPDEAGRFVGDDARYNAAAADVMRVHHIPTDDLYALTKTFSPGDFQEPGNVHFQPAAYMRIAQQVAASIRSSLKT